jgi:hypothetical protein
MVATASVGMLFSTASNDRNVLALANPSIRAHRQKQTVVDVRPTLNDGHIKTMTAIGAVRQRLVEAAVLGLRHPVGAERKLLQWLCGRGRNEKPACDR